MGRIEIKEHAYQRIMSDRFCKTKPKSREEAKLAIEKDLKFSCLLKLNKDGTELRGHNGKVYVCSIKEDEIVVITVLKGNRFVN